MAGEINAVLAWVHILAAIGWMGAAMFLLMVLSPSMVTLSPASRKELILRLFPRFIRYVAGFATLTIVAGTLLAFAILGFQFDPSTPLAMRISVGALLALVAYGLAIGVGLRSAQKLVKILSAPQDSQQGPPADVASLQRRIRLTATSVVTLLTLALVFMVAAARL